MNERFFFDTNALSEPLRPAPSPAFLNRFRAHAHEIATAAPVLHELMFGARRLPPSRRRNTIEHYIRDVVLVTLPVLSYDAMAAQWHADERARLWERDPHCAIRLELTRQVDEEAGTDYHEVAERLAEWQRTGVLVRDPRPGFYVLRQRFAAPDGARVERVGWFAALRLEDYEKRVVRPHERTLATPKADRLKLLRATRANLSAIFFLYEDRELALAPFLAAALEVPDAAPVLDAEGVEHTLVRVEDRDTVAAVRSFLADRPSVIADGHHRYETALAYRDERLRAEPGAGEDAPFRSILGYFANAYARTVTGMPFRDCTSGFQCLTRRALETVGLTEIQSSGYSFLIELKYRVVHAGLSGTEVPIIFTQRRAGASKISKTEIARSMITPWRMRFGLWDKGPDAAAAPRGNGGPR